MKKRLLFSTTLVVMGLAPGSIAFAAPNPSPTGTGQPNQTCQIIEAQPGGMAPGNASSSPGSVFNEPILNSQFGGTGGQHYNLAGAPSQYDVACYQVSQSH